MEDRGVVNRKPYAFAKNLATSHTVAMLPSSFFGIMESLKNGGGSDLVQRKQFTPIDGKLVQLDDFFSYSVTDKGIAIIEITGAIIPYSQTDFCGSYPGLDTYLQLTDLALSDSSVKGILYVIDSGGGSASMLEIFYNEMQKRKKKPMQTFVSEVCCSAAYYIASAVGGKITLGGETSIVGSIGTVCTYTDYKEYYKSAGIEVFDITATDSTNKRLSSDATNDVVIDYYRKNYLDPINAVFVAKVTEARRLTIDKINAKTVIINEREVAVPFTGQTYTGKAAIAAGLADNINGLSETIDAFSKSIDKENKVNKQKNSSEMNFDKIKAVFGLSGDATKEPIAEDLATAAIEDLVTANSEISSLKLQNENLQNEISNLQNLQNENAENLAKITNEKIELATALEVVKLSLEEKQTEISNLEERLQSSTVVVEDLAKKINSIQPLKIGRGVAEGESSEKFNRRKKGE